MLSTPLVLALALATGDVWEALICTLLVEFALLTKLASPAVLADTCCTSEWVCMKPAHSIS
jgi:hypothetical protein